MIEVYVSMPEDVTIKNLSIIKSVNTRAYELLSQKTEIRKFAYCDWFITSEKLAA